MAHKTITISEEAYEALAAVKAAKESFTEVILRIVKKREEGTLLDVDILGVPHGVPRYQLPNRPDSTRS